MSFITMLAYLTYHASGILSWFIKQPTWNMVLPSARPLRDWGLLWFALILTASWWALFSAPFALGTVEAPVHMTINLASSATLLDTLFDNILEEISRFGLWFALLVLIPRLPRWVVMVVVSIWFSLIHGYYINMPTSFSAYWPFYLLAFGASFILFAVGFRFGILVALIFHVLFNIASVGFSFGFPGAWIWLNWPLGALCFAAIFWLLRRVPMKPVFAETTSPPDRQTTEIDTASHSL